LFPIAADERVLHGGVKMLCADAKDQARNMRATAGKKYYKILELVTLCPPCQSYYKYSSPKTFRDIF